MAFLYTAECCRCRGATSWATNHLAALKKTLREYGWEVDGRIKGYEVLCAKCVRELFVELQQEQPEPKPEIPPGDERLNKFLGN